MKQSNTLLYIGLGALAAVIVAGAVLIMMRSGEEEGPSPYGNGSTVPTGTEYTQPTGTYTPPTRTYTPPPTTTSTPPPTSTSTPPPTPPPTYTGYY